jgi:hypothetical protein
MAITDRTRRIIRKLFPEAHVEAVAARLECDCGAGFFPDRQTTSSDHERLQFAVLKLSEGRLDRLAEAIREAKVDWRDTLMGAGFGYDVDEHVRWAEGFLDS